MDGRQKPDAQADSANDRKQNDIIDLTKVVRSGKDDAIIDLKTIMGQPGTVPEALQDPTDQTPDAQADQAAEPVEPVDPPTAEEADDAFIDLADLDETIDDETAASAPVDADDDDDVIDLLDAVEPDDQTSYVGDADFEITVTDALETTLRPDQDLEVESESTDAIEDAPDDVIVTATPAEAEDADDDEIIDLTGMDIVTGDDIQGIDSIASEEAEEEEEIIDLLDAVVPETSAAASDEGTPAQPAVGEAPDADEPLDFSIGTGMEAAADEADQSVLPDEPPIPAAEDVAAPADALAPPAADAVPLSEDQLQAALERTIERVYAEKIEQLMIQTIEKTVRREIEKIRKALMEDADDASD